MSAEVILVLILLAHLAHSKLFTVSVLYKLLTYLLTTLNTYILEYYVCFTSLKQHDNLFFTTIFSSFLHICLTFSQTDRQTDKPVGDMVRSLVTI